MPTGCRRFQCASYPHGSWSGSPSPGLVNTDGVPSEVHSCDSGSPTAAEKVLNHIVFIRKRVPIMHVVIRCKQIIIKKHLQILEGNVGIHLCSAIESIRGGEFGVLNAGELPDAAVRAIPLKRQISDHNKDSVLESLLDINSSKCP